MKQWQLALSLLILALLFRWGTFGPSVLNHDESTYLIVGGALLDGAVYHRDVIDTKPIGIFWIYAVLVKLTGGNIFWLRFLATGVLAATAYLLNWTLLRAGRGRVAGAAAGAGVIVMASVYTHYGLSPNTELFFNLFTVGAVGLAVAPRVGGRARAWHWPVAGVLLGCAVTIKPAAAAEALAVGLFMVWYYRYEWRRLLTSGLALVAGFCLPLLVVFAYYAHHGITDRLWYYTLTVAGNYPVELAWYLRLKYLGDYLLRYAPFVVLGGWAVYRHWRAGGRDRAWILFLLLQFALVSIMVLVPGKRFGHYQEQLHPVLAMLAGSFFAWVRREVAPSRARTRRIRYGAAGVMGLGLVVGVLHFLSYRSKVDHGRIIAGALAPHLGPEETFFAASGGHVAHHLLDRLPPTPYIHYSILILDSHLDAFSLDPVREAEQMLTDPNFRYLVFKTDDPGVETELVQQLLPHFTPFLELEDRIMVYRR